MKDRDEWDTSGSGAGKDAMLSVLAALAGVGLGANPIPATLVASAGPAAKWVHELWTDASTRRSNRAARAIQHAADIMDVGVDIFMERASAYDARLELLAQVLEAAARTSMEDKIKSLGRVLADGLRDGSHLDEARLLVSMVNDLEAPHVIVLQLIAEQPVPPQATWTSPSEPRGWERHHLALVLPNYDGILDGLLAALIRHGTLRTLGDATWDGIAQNYSHGITSLGLRCLQLFGREQANSGLDAG